jgi:Ras-related protein Rab-2A
VIKLDNKVVKLQIWDTAGQESFRSITRIFYRGAQIVFLTFDITREETFSNLGDWLKEIKQHASPDVTVFLIGCKSDLEDSRAVQKEQAREFCVANNILAYFETSAKTGDNVEDVFATAAKDAYVKEMKEKQAQEDEEKAKTDAATPGKGGNTTKGMKLNSAQAAEKTEKKKGCC